MLFLNNLHSFYNIYTGAGALRIDDEAKLVAERALLKHFGVHQDDLVRIASCDRLHVERRASHRVRSPAHICLVVSLIRQDKTKSALFGVKFKCKTLNIKRYRTRTVQHSTAVHISWALWRYRAPVLCRRLGTCDHLLQAVSALEFPNSLAARAPAWYSPPERLSLQVLHWLNIIIHTLTKH